MKNRPIDRMKDPFYAQLLVRVEDIICQADDAAKGESLVLTDSQVKSALVKTRKKLRGTNPAIPETNEREKILAKLVFSLCHAPDDLTVERTNPDESVETLPVKTSDLRKAIETVEASLKNRKSDLPGSRDYLDYVHRFLRKVKRK